MPTIENKTQILRHVYLNVEVLDKYHKHYIIFIICQPYVLIYLNLKIVLCIIDIKKKQS